jgi:hypothetical protein
MMQIHPEFGIHAEKPEECMKKGSILGTEVKRTASIGEA